MFIDISAGELFAPPLNPKPNQDLHSCAIVNVHREAERCSALHAARFLASSLSEKSFSACVLSLSNFWKVALRIASRT